MNFPINLGWTQIVLLLICLVGLGLFISAVRSLLPRREAVSEEDKEEYRRTGRWPYRYRRHFGWKRGLAGIIVLVIAFLLLWTASLVQSYLSLTGEIKVAQVHASTIANVPNEMSVELTLYDQNGHVTTDNTYIVLGNEWMIQGDIVKFPGWMNILGFHSGYKLTRMQGRYDDSNLERHAEHTVVDLNGGDDNFFKTVHSQQNWFGPFVDASYGNAVFEPADGTYDVFVTQDALIARKTS